MSSLKPQISDLSLADFSTDLFDEDEDDFLHTPFFNKPTTSTKTKTGQTQATNYLRRVETDAIEEYKVFLSNFDQLETNTNANSYEHYIVYFHCPVCLNSEFKTIQHIKLCASKNMISPRDVISLLRQCPKTTRKKFTSDNKAARPAERKSKDKSQKLYELQLFDQQHKQQLIEKRVAKMLGGGLRKQLVDQSDDDDDHNLLPLSWKLSHLTYDSTNYVIQDFSKYYDAKF